MHLSVKSSKHTDGRWLSMMSEPEAVGNSSLWTEEQTHWLIRVWADGIKSSSRPGMRTSATVAIIWRHTLHATVWTVGPKNVIYSDSPAVKRATLVTSGCWGLYLAERAECSWRVLGEELWPPCGWGFWMRWRVWWRCWWAGCRDPPGARAAGQRQFRERQYQQCTGRFSFCHATCAKCVCVCVTWDVMPPFWIFL